MSKHDERRLAQYENTNTNTYTQYLDSAFGLNAGTASKLNSFLWKHCCFFDTLEEYEKVVKENFPSDPEYIAALQLTWMAYENACLQERIDEYSRR